jgi:hypothetical protein
MVRNDSKYEFWVQRSRSGAFIAKFFDVTSFSELVRKWRQFRKFCIDFRNAPKHEFWVECSGSGAVVTKNANATSFSELVS